MRRIPFAPLLLCGLVLAGAARAETLVVAVDPPFVPVAEILSQAFTDRTGHALRLAPLRGGTVPDGADVVLAPDAGLPQRLVDQGLADPATQLTYAMGATGTDAATEPRDAILMRAAGDDAAARAFMEYLQSSDAWDLIVTHGHGAY